MSCFERVRWRFFNHQFWDFICFELFLVFDLEEKRGDKRWETNELSDVFFTCPVNDEPTALKNQGTTDKKGDGTSWYQMFEGELSWRAPVLHKKPQPRDICAMASVSPINSSALSRSCTNKLHDRISNEPCLSQTVDVFKTLVLFDICGFAGLQEKLRCSRQLFLISPIFTWWKFEIQAWELPLLHL